MTSEERIDIYNKNIRKSEDEIYYLIEESVDNKELQEIYIRILNDINGLQNKFMLDEKTRQGFDYTIMKNEKIFVVSKDGEKELSQEEFKIRIAEGQEECKKLVEERRRNYK